MPKFTTKPVLVEASQFLMNSEIPPGVQFRKYPRGYERADGFRPQPGASGFFVETLQGSREVLPGHWVLKGNSGYYSLMTDDTFRSLHEEVKS